MNFPINELICRPSTEGKKSDVMSMLARSDIRGAWLGLPTLQNPKTPVQVMPPLIDSYPPRFATNGTCGKWIW